jgi:hypothetical protein
MDEPPALPWGKSASARDPFIWRFAVTANMTAKTMDFVTISRMSADIRELEFRLAGLRRTVIGGCPLVRNQLVAGSQAASIWNPVSPPLVDDPAIRALTSFRTRSRATLWKSLW